MVVTNLVLKIVRLFVDKKAGFAKPSESDSMITLPSHPFVATILRQYFIFNLSHDSFGLLVKNELVVLKDYHILFENIKLAVSKSKDKVLTSEDIPKNIFAVHINESKKINALVSRAN